MKIEFGNRAPEKTSDTNQKKTDLYQDPWMMILEG
jgi:hypothetical protein